MKQGLLKRPVFLSASKMFFSIQVYVGKVQVSRHQLKSFLKSAEILRIRGLVQSNHTKDQIFDRASTDEKLSGSSNSHHEAQEPSEDEPSSKRQSEIPPSDSGGSKRPRLQSRPPAKPVTTTITPGKLGYHSTQPLM